METNNAFSSDSKKSKKEIDEVVIPARNDDAGISNPDEVVIPRKDDNDVQEILDEVVIPRKETEEGSL